MRERIVAGIDSRWLQTRDGDGAALHRAYRDAGRPVLEMPSPAPGASPPPAPPSSPTSDIEGHQIQDLAELVPELIEASAGHQLKFRVQLLLDDAPEEVRTNVEELMRARLKVGPDSQA